jgi:hypothetical protein
VAMHDTQRIATSRVAHFTAEATPFKGHGRDPRL